MTALPEYRDSLPTLNIPELEGIAIRIALRQTGGKVNEAAKILGIGRATLYRRLKKEDGDRWRDELKKIVNAAQAAE